ncbi:MULTISPECIES: peptide-methionine (S)-S-oxide reductase MsrA [unclassified Erythrobacter]|uniref:peptide-methionine (S)-S-oxide reductase MsrA n=1 Tax=Erythrobacteraceae TaxID=335929 RepID=UPI00076D2403|nr:MULTISPECIES: peptide-methionine (S)-S-oxide reductase MsrA [unclassified Erythrobacter]KWV94914.1 methionine sulfoxide reductase A [Erythrobacter sp. AP23]MBO6527711.1 peptide-methionine (S)-S-oxide reductase MsrA [Erythrobacter sp.]MBO6530034.1 peptide-methionine (S)-S-oxide reductase MsrA [Erythrobacter sp.]
MRLPAALAAAALALGVSACQQPAIAAEKAVAAPAAKRVADEGAGLKTAIFAGGCFWGVEGVFSHVRGVKSAVSGYHGGTRRQADYKLVSSGVTDHAEAVKVVYDPAVIRYDQLLRIFFSVVADPTQLNRQGPDVGAHYRSALVPQSREQAAVAAAYLQQLRAAKLWSKPIVTRIEKARTFYPAETYHQDFMLKNPRHGYIVRWDAPKVKALKAMYPGVYSADFQPG